jgi:hypothetical protein
MDPVPVIIQMRQIKPVRINTLHAKAERYRDGFVKLFREYEHAYVLNEDGTEMLDGAGRRVAVTASWFAREMGIPKQTFHQWLNGRSVRNDDSSPRDEEGWDLPGVPQETVEKIRQTVEGRSKWNDILDVFPNAGPLIEATELLEGALNEAKTLEDFTEIIRCAEELFAFWHGMKMTAEREAGKALASVT